VSSRVYFQPGPGHYVHYIVASIFIARGILLVESLVRRPVAERGGRGKFLLQMMRRAFLHSVVSIGILRLVVYIVLPLLAGRPTLPREYWPAVTHRTLWPFWLADPSQIPYFNSRFLVHSELSFVESYTWTVEVLLMFDVLVGVAVMLKQETSAVFWASVSLLISFSANDPRCFMPFLCTGSWPYGPEKYTIMSVRGLRVIGCTLGAMLVLLFPAGKGKGKLSSRSKVGRVLAYATLSLVLLYWLNPDTHTHGALPSWISVPKPLGLGSMVNRVVEYTFRDQYALILIIPLAAPLCFLLHRSDRLRRNSLVQSSVWQNYAGMFYGESVVWYLKWYYFEDGLFTRAVVLVYGWLGPFKGFVPMGDVVLLSDICFTCVASVGFESAFRMSRRVYFIVLQPLVSPHCLRCSSVCVYMCVSVFARLSCAMCPLCCCMVLRRLLHASGACARVRTETDDWCCEVVYGSAKD
jgi:hypothetical protein